MSINEQPDTARIEAVAAAIAVNPVYENERLAELTHWGAPWANLRVVVVGMGTSGDAVTDVLAQLGAKIVVIDGADTPEKRERIDLVLKLSIEGRKGNTLEEAIAHLPDFRMDLIYQETGRLPVHYAKVMLKITAEEIAALAGVALVREGGRKNG